ncbi:MAG: bifunctional diaminohydroxyphosphoribosylaminopyrimidine deaminase/5-amino-6-(5-phosphoribosylamino)uracil reductase RibD [Chloroflexi bacterium]|nr:bifunctional diaminohydroxyphosphoribosylaminopyrimidine deaminase/5-amino-6-(5-phosphoribosylamino)uracil reductase RibD [Chloroflexota bacterium]
MRRALALARGVLGRTSPNPAVGAVVVRDGRVVGEGATQPPGQAHAEIVALAQSGAAARGAALYVTLEPCAHYGRTPPCTLAVITAGVARVVVATPDPNPLTAGRGLAELRAAGVAVEVGLCADEARELNEWFAHYIATGRPFTLAKFAMSLDGKIATATGEARWISGPAARERVHEWRDVYDAIMVGAGTVLADDPELTARPRQVARPPCHPLRVVVDARGRIAPTARVFQPDLPGRTLVATTEQAPAGWRAALDDQGVEVLALPQRDGLVDLPALWRALGDRAVASVLLEGGAALLASAVAAGLVGKLAVFVAPKLIGGAQAPGPLGGSGWPRLAEAPMLRFARFERVGDDVLILAYPREAACSPAS